MRKNKGFTLVELIIVIAILAVIIAIAVMSYPGIVRRFKIRSDISSGKQIGKSLSVRNVDIGENLDEIPLFPKIVKYNEIAGVDKYISNQLVPSSFINGFYYASKLINSYGAVILVGIGGEDTTRIEKSYDGDGPGWVYLEIYDLNRFISDNRDTFKEEVEIVPGSNLDWKKEETPLPTPTPGDDENSELLSKVCNVGSWVKYTPSVNSYESKKEDNGFGNQMFKPSSYSGGFRVISISGDSVTLISEKSVGNLTLRGKIGYMNATGAINKVCSQYVNSFAASARSVGSSGNSSVSEPEFLYDNYKTDSSIPSKWNDGAYSSDVSKLKSASILNIGEEYWLGSRYATTTPTESSFIINFINNSGVVRGYTLYYIRSDGTTGEFDDTIGIRPVITLNSSVKVKSGDGSKSNPFEIEL